MSPESGQIETDILIIGAGILGAAACLELSAEGADVLVVERKTPNAEASGTNAGGLQFQLANQPDYTPERLRAVTAYVQAHVAAFETWKRLSSELGADLEVELGGGLVVSDADDDLPALRAKVAFERGLGIETELVVQEEIARLAPLLSPRLTQAVYAAVDGHANPLLVVPALLAQATARSARVMPGHGVVEIEVKPRGFAVRAGKTMITARRIVAAAGAWTGQIGRMVGVTLPITGRLAQVLVTERSPLKLSQMVQHFRRPLSLKQSRHGTFLIGGGWPGRYDAATDTRHTLFSSIAGNAQLAASVLPDLDDILLLRSWVGMQPVTPDRLPIVGAIDSVPGFFVLHVPFNGFALGPLMGRAMADLLLGREPRVPLASYAANRFH